MHRRSIIAAGLLVLAVHAAAQPADSLRLALRRLAVRAAALEADRTAFWRRAVPRVEVAAGLSAGALLLAPDGEAVLLPRDSYRLSVSLSVGALLDGSSHAEALVRLARAETELSLDEAMLAEARGVQARRRSAADSLRALRREEVALRAELLRYEELLFRQGNAAFDALLRARLGLVAARAAALAPGEDEP